MLSKEGKKATPAIINQEIAGLERAAATLKTMDTILQHGGKATYIQCDVSDHSFSAGSNPECIKPGEND